eukprot:TRINITY_DN63143_c0_g1_i1.p1 TRINITY_DN63143_c0_g1~~TRINITY_DN63143_c0_g1_i1.p1  ORF type:complete len:525 (+),score=275.76 TRINITY_DN63143_c0_g1_i1:26-1600(+)
MLSLLRRTRALSSTRRLAARTQTHWLVFSGQTRGLRTEASSSSSASGKKEEEKAFAIVDSAKLAKHPLHRVLGQDKQYSEAMTSIAVPGRFHDDDLGALLESNDYDRDFEVPLLEKQAPAKPSLEERLEIAPALYGAPALVAEHAEEHVGQYMFVAESDEKLAWPEDLLKPHDVELDVHHGRYLLVRKQLLKLKEHLLALEAGGDAAAELERCVAVIGDEGTGKSVAVLYALLFAKQQGWLVLSCHADSLVRDTLGLITPSETEEGLYDQGRLSSHMLTTWLEDATHHEALDKIQVKLDATKAFVDKVQANAAAAADEHEADAKKKQDNGDGDGESSAATESRAAASKNVVTLLDFLSLANHAREEAAAMMQCFLDELREATEVPVMIAVDGANKLWTDSPFVDPAVTRGVKHLPAQSLSLVRQFDSFRVAPPANGVALFASTSQGPQAPVRELFASGGEPGAAPVKVVRSFEYSRRQLIRVLQHYRVSGLLARQVDRRNVAYLYGITGGFPRELHNYLFSNPV